VTRQRSGFGAVAFAFLIVMAFATLPSPLYGLYREHDGLSSFTITVVYAIFAAGTIAALLAVPAVARRIGRRGVMLAAVATMIGAAVLLAAWKDLPGLLVGRFITGIAVGLVAGIAITYLIELHLHRDPNGSPIRARNIGTAINVGALGIGPLVAGCLAAWVRDPLTVPYLLWIALGAVALVGLAAVPETGAPATPAPAEKQKTRAWIPVPAGTATLAAFSANGLFAGLSGLFLAVTFHHPSHALAGLTLFIVFSAGVASQLATTRLRASLVLALGTVSMLVGLVLLVTAVRLHRRASRYF
jgi:MFS family permease